MLERISISKYQPHFILKGGFLIAAIVGLDTRATIQHELTHWYAKLTAMITVGYALSPIDIIPDFIPVIRFIKDAILLPALIWLSLRLIPINVRKPC
ncbi:YkvA family protein [Sedimentibacter sp. MB31-C6]|uniref:YkvA family protein n=1 Tax=Sedimentibacter sp. MB31-C6 TaxID=3109366 RepID=UPI00289E9A14|nr:MULTISPECIES: DUF1232 domain-containing protein [unclassified Sedimentibacter]WSI03095.1 DUF1232 domain-containing protein [Sedimentibacter sp. MB36-C1]